MNKSNKSEHLRLNVEPELKEFMEDYAANLGVSLSAAIRRLVLIGANCETEHGQTRMPISYDTFLQKQQESANYIKGVTALAATRIQPPEFTIEEDWYDPT